MLQYPTFHHFASLADAQAAYRDYLATARYESLRSLSFLAWLDRGGYTYRTI